MLTAQPTGGAGSSLPTPVLLVSGLATLVAVVVSGMSVHLQLRNYRKPALQRMVVRIMIMVPLYAVSSLISLFSLEAAFFIDAIRDIYEAFVIYAFFTLLLSYLGGERALLILLHGRPPKAPVFPVSLWKREIDVSDPYTFLFLKRGIMQYVQVKPILAVVTMLLKALGKYNEGTFRADSGYLYVSLVYNASICLSLYCLAVFWMCVNDDLKPFRPVPKFLCVKGILFFSFWQAATISILVSAGVITHLGPYTRHGPEGDEEKIALALTDTLICLEMPLFALAHAYAFSYTDFIDPHTTYVARMPMYYALRDAFGARDVLVDTRETLRGEGMDYRAFEPSEGYMHQGEGRDRRIRAGLRYAEGGRRKYWLPQPAERTHVGLGGGGEALGRDGLDDVYAPLMAAQEADVVHLAPDLAAAEVARTQQEPNIWDGGLHGYEDDNEDGYGLPFGDKEELGDEELFAHARQFVFGDYNYPTIDVSSEHARTAMWDEEERVLRDERSAWYSPIRGAQVHQVEARERPRWEGYGAVGRTVVRPHAPPPPSDDVQGEGRLIDHNEGPTPEGVDVRLRWTKGAGAGAPPPHSRTNSNASQTKAHLPARTKRGSFGSTPGSSPGNNSNSRTHTPPALSRHNSGAPLPPDAVDLVVEDPHAAEEHRAQERRKGEPQIGGSALRKVYRRGFVDEDEGEGEVEVLDEREGLRSPGRGEGDDGDGEEGGREVEEFAGHEPEAIVARATTPPAHARGFVPSDSEDNPWLQ
ncbi:DUF300 domain-containing protein [Mycena albidolilacea]|uniref:DUF300 domain-containing protein n=1 Tax=Mycena albidolilacea TaxID=1033008 RepID=A0AAD6YYI8_9AGAR|nr:DUF300 domain-containing protein [Mycena albidolilacea]